MNPEALLPLLSAARAEGLSVGTLQILCILAAKNDQRSTDLADQLDVSPAAVHGLLNRLAVRNFIRRRHTDKDGRVVRAQILPLGQVAIERILSNILTPA